MPTNNSLRVLTFPKDDELERILDHGSIDIISPYYSGWALDKISPRDNSKVRLITRLPTDCYSPPPFLDNDPKPLLSTMERLGAAFSVYGLPTVHAKLYINATSAWAGSANLTKTGFSGVGELLLRFTPATGELKNAFDEIKAKSKQVSTENVRKLVTSLDLGLTHIRPTVDIPQGAAVAPVTSAGSYQDFELWLKTRVKGEQANYIIARIHNYNFMSGHTYSGFHGVSSFLVMNKAIAYTLLPLKEPPIPGEILDKLAGFVNKYGHKFGGPNGGTWNKKLSVRLGGTHSGGGAGDVVVKRLLILIPKYLSERGLL